VDPDVTADLECVPLNEPPLIVLTVGGELNLASAPRLRSAILKCLADQPTAIIVDAAALVVADDIHLTVFIALARQAAAWPSIPILVCAPPPEVAAALSRLGIDRHVIICASVREGRLRAARQELPPTLRDELLPVVGSVRAARRLVEDACRRWRLPHLAPPAGLVVSELVANAVRHAGTSIELLVTRTGRHLHLAVRDLQPRLARLVGPAAEDQPGGRGLLIVEAIATHWGCIPTHDGKVTWASLAVR
jgi:anti-anti-sigma regulatory factor